MKECIDYLFKFEKVAEQNKKVLQNIISEGRIDLQIEQSEDEGMLDYLFRCKNYDQKGVKDPLVIMVEENLDMEIGRDVNTVVGNNLISNIEKKIETSANDLNINIEQNAECNIGEKLTQIANETDMLANGGDILIKSAGKALLQGAVDARISKG